MEVARKMSKSGKIYRIYDNNPAWHVYEIERMKVCGGDVVWVPVVEPKNKLYTNLQEAMDALEALMDD